MKEKRNFKKRFVNGTVLIILLILIGVLLYYFLSFLREPSVVFLIKQDILFDEEIVDALILRDEMIITDDSDRILQQDKFEGEKVSKGMKVFKYFPTQESKELDRMFEIEQEIQEYLLEQQDNISSSENIIIDNAIESKLLELNGLNQYSKILNLEKNINDEILEKAKMAGELSKEGTQIKKLLDEKKSIEKKLSDKSEIVCAPIAGIVSYRVDGYEEQFNKKDLNTITQQTILDYDIKSGSIIPETNNKSKIVNNFVTYLALISKSEHSNNANVGDKIKIRIGNEEEAIAIIKAINQADEDSQIIILKLNTNAIQLLQYRKLRIEIIWWEETGLKVNNKSILKEDDYSYVVRQRGKLKEKILVKVIKETNDFSLINNYSEEELNNMDINLTENQVIIKENDLILLNPEKYFKQ